MPNQIELITVPASAIDFSNSHSHSPNSFHSQLVSTINRGYNKPRFTYNVIETPRVKDSIIDDFNIKDQDNFHFGFLFATSTSTSTSSTKFNSNDDGKLYTNKLIEKYPVGSFNIDPTNVKYFKSSKRLQELIKQYENNLEFQILGTIAIKPFNETETKNEFEITAFTSFYPGVSPYLLSFIDKFSKIELNANKLWVDVIEAHLLTEYYEKFGFKFVRRIHCKVDPITHLLVGEALEDGVKASCDFNLILMSKDL